MEYILTASEMKACDKLASEKYHIDPMILMERAALETAKLLVERYGTDILVGIVAGTGNNGGDGIAIARILHEYGVRAEINLVGEMDKCSPQTVKQLEIVKELGIPVQYVMDHPLYDVIVDAIFGIGLSREIQGGEKEAIDLINESNARVVSVDIPSGIHADSGAVMGNAVKADITVTYGFKKLGQLLYPGAQYVGELVCVPIGIPKEAFESKKTGVVAFQREDVHLPYRNPAGNKGSFGKVFLIAGSKNMGGACQLTALSAFRIGAGMVKILTAEENRDSLLKKVPEAIVTTYYDDGLPALLAQEERILQEGLQWADVVAIGPGLSLSAKAKYIFALTMKMNTKTLVMDADALNLLAEDEKLMQTLEYHRNEIPYEIIMTPHVGEFSRLIHYPVPKIKKDLLGYCRAFTKKYQVSLVCKDARTIVTRRYKHSFLNTSGNSGMATAGSGDVLTGIIAGLLAQGVEGYEAAVLGTYIHGLAGDIALERSSAYYFMSQDLIRALRFL